MISQDVARTELARKLVQLSKEGIREEGRLSAAGLIHLHQLTLKNGQIKSPVHAAAPFWASLPEDAAN